MWLFDTNVLSELRRVRPSPTVLAFVARCEVEHLHISCVTLAELRFGIDSMADPLRQAELNIWLYQTVRPMFEDRVLNITEDIMLRWRFLFRDTRKAGRSLSSPDLLIAAIALEHNLTLVTRNVKDFTNLGLDILDPWNDRRRN